MYVFKTVAILTIEPTVKSNFKFNISQQIGWRKVSLKIITKKEKIIIKLKSNLHFFKWTESLPLFSNKILSVSNPLDKASKIRFLILKFTNINMIFHAQKMYEGKIITMRQNKKIIVWSSSTTLLEKVQAGRFFFFFQIKVELHGIIVFLSLSMKVQMSLL